MFRKIELTSITPASYNLCCKNISIVPKNSCLLSNPLKRPTYGVSISFCVSPVTAVGRATWYFPLVGYSWTLFHVGKKHTARRSTGGSSPYGNLPLDLLFFMPTRWGRIRQPSAVVRNVRTFCSEQVKCHHRLDVISISIIRNLCPSNRNSAIFLLGRNFRKAPDFIPNHLRVHILHRLASKFTSEPRSVRYRKYFTS